MTKFKDDSIIKDILTTTLFRTTLLTFNFGASVLLARYLSLSERGVISGVLTGVTVFSSVISALQIERILKFGCSIYTEVKSKSAWFVILCILSSTWLQQRYDLNVQTLFLIMFNFLLTYLNALLVNSIFKFQSITVANVLYLTYSTLIFAILSVLIIAESLTVLSYLFFASIVELLIFILSVLFHQLGPNKLNFQKKTPTAMSSKIAWYAAFLESNSVALFIFSFSILTTSKFIALLTLTLSILSPYLLLVTVLTPFILNSNFKIRVPDGKHALISDFAKACSVLFTLFACTYIYFLFLSNNVTKLFGKQYYELQDLSALICLVGSLLTIDKILMLVLRRFSEDYFSLATNVLRYLLYALLGFLCASNVFNYEMTLFGLATTSIIACAASFLRLGMRFQKKRASK